MLLRLLLWQKIRSIPKLWHINDEHPQAVAYNDEHPQALAAACQLF